MKAMDKKLFIEGKLHTITGLHIGGNSGGLQIGGADNTVVRNLLNNQPYIPGSSLRGKMRSLLERVRGPETQSKEGGYSEGSKDYLAGTDPNTLLGQLFGTSADKASISSSKSQVTRLIVRDAFLNPDSVKRLDEASNTDMPMTEVKTEVAINRITSKPDYGPREIERVPAGAIFNLGFILTIYKEDPVDKFLSLFFESLELIESDSLGGSGSRGYGRVLFKEFKVFQKTAEDYKNHKERQNWEGEIPSHFTATLEQDKAS